MGILSGRILMPSSQADATQGDASLHEKSTGALIDTIASALVPASGSIPFCAVGDVLPSGRWCVPYQNPLFTGLAILDDDDQLITTIPKADLVPVGAVSPFAFVRSDHNSSFWVLAYDSSAVGTLKANLHQVSEDGVILASYLDVVTSTRPDLPGFAAYQLNNLAVTYDGTKLYVAIADGVTTKVFVYHILTDTWDASPLITLAGYYPDFDGLILCAGGTRLLLALTETLGGSVYRSVALYDLAGTQVALRDPLGPVRALDPLEIGCDPLDDDSVYAKWIGVDELTYTLYKLSVTDLSDLWTPPSDDTLENGGQAPASCPLLVFPDGATEPTPGEESCLTAPPTLACWNGGQPNARAVADTPTVPQAAGWSGTYDPTDLQVGLLNSDVQP